MRTSLRMTQETANLIGSLRRENVLKLACLLLDLRLAIHRQTVCKQPLSQPMPPDNVRGLFTSTLSEFDN